MEAPPDSTFLRRAAVLGTPLILGALELGHPRLVPGTSLFKMISPIAKWWTILHLLQIPLFALLGVAVYLLLKDIRGVPATISRVAILLFIVFYPAFDAAVGIASGVIILSLDPRSPLEATMMGQQLQALFFDPVTRGLGIAASLFWFISTLAAAVAVHDAGAPRTCVFLLALAGVLLGISHVQPYGPLACVSFFLAALQLELCWRKSGPIAADIT